MKNYLKKNWLNYTLGALSLIAMWLVWIIAVKTVKNEYVVPSVTQTINALFTLFGEEIFWLAVLSSLKKVLYAFLISFALALTLSLLGKVFKSVGVFFKPILTVVRTLPTMAILVLILIYTNKTIAPVIVAVLVLFPMIYAQFNVAFEGIDDGIISTVKAYKLTKSQAFFKVYLPMIAPSIVSHTGSNLSFGIKLIISAEVMAYSYTSIGGLMQAANGVFDISRLAALTLVAVFLGLIVEVVFYVISAKAFKWQKAEVEND